MTSVTLFQIDGGKHLKKQTGTHCVVKVFNGELGEAFVNQVRFAFRSDRFKPDETKVNSVAIHSNYSILPLLIKDPEVEFNDSGVYI